MSEENQVADDIASEATEETNTLQVDNNIETDIAEGETPNDSDLATETSQDKDDKTTDAVKKAINNKHFEAKEAERKQLAAERRVQELEQQIQDEQQAKIPDELPPPPSEYADNYEQEMLEWQAQYKAKSEYDARQAVLIEQHAQQQQLQYEENAKRIHKQASIYTKDAETAGIKPNELAQYADEVTRYGIAPELSEGLLYTDNGGLVLKYLANNLEHLDKLNYMSGFQQANYIAQHIKPHVDNLKPNQSNTPAPPTDVTGGGVDPEAGKYPNSGGATFE